MPGPDPLQPLRIPESRLLFIYVADIRRGAAGRTDCCSRMAGLQGFSPLRETERWLVPQQRYELEARSPRQVHPATVLPGLPSTLVYLCNSWMSRFVALV